MSVDFKTVVAELRRHERLSFPPDALYWIFACVRQTSKRVALQGPHQASTSQPSGAQAALGQPLHEAPASGSAPSGFTPEILAHAIQERAKQQFGALAPTVLRTWGLNSGRDLGQALATLVKLGALRLEPGEGLHPYDALGAL